MGPRAITSWILLALLASTAEAKHGHSHLTVLERKHQQHRKIHKSVAELGEKALELRSEDPIFQKRGGQCPFPSDAGLVPVTPGEQNAGWAMSPDQPCEPGNYCPYACPPGQVSAQWNPKATSYSFPMSMDGGLYCDDDGHISKPFPDKPYCVDGTGSVGVQNNADGVVSFCQTVLPGNEAMLIPTSIEDWEQLAVPDTSYWCGTAAHFYINPPGVGCEEACIWGTKSDPIGNWSPYVAGANTDENGETFVKLGWNPIYLEPATPFRDEMPTWGVEVVCETDGCNGLPCAIDPSKNGVNEMVGGSSSGAGGGAFCVVTVPKGGKANFVVFDSSSGSGQGKSHNPSSQSSSDSPSPSASSSAWSTTSSTSSWYSSSDYTTSSSAAYPTEYEHGNKTGHHGSRPAVSPHIFVENSTETFSATALTASATQTDAPAQETKKGAASATRISILSFALGFLIVTITWSF